MTRLATDMDMHVHSTFSDGSGTIDENVAAAEAAGLSRMACVDHVRATTTWAPEFAAAVRSANSETEVDLRCGVEAKLLDTTGALDLPVDIGGADHVYAADHQVPTPDGPAHPKAVRARIERGQLAPATAVEWIVEATAAAVRKRDDVVIAHLFSVLPKIGLEEAGVPLDLLESLAANAAAAGARIEVDERWRCPSARTLRPFVGAGVEVLLSTDSHRPETIGRYDYCLAVSSELSG